MAKKKGVLETVTLFLFFARLQNPHERIYCRIILMSIFPTFEIQT